MLKSELYKKLYGDEPIKVENGKVEIPHYLVMLIRDYYGLKSKKNRIIKKKVKQFILPKLELAYKGLS